MALGGFSKARLARMHQVMASYVEQGTVAGLVTLLSRRGETMVDTIGYQDLVRRDPMRRDTIFRIASMTKPDRCGGGRDDPGGGASPRRSTRRWIRGCRGTCNRRVLRRIDGPLDETEPAT